MMKTTLSHIDHAGWNTAEFANDIERNAKRVEPSVTLMHDGARHATSMAMV